MTQGFVAEPVLVVIRQMTPGRRYLASDLYEIYASACKAEDREPDHLVPFGRQLRAAGLIKCTVLVGGSGRGKKGKRGVATAAWML